MNETTSEAVSSELEKPVQPPDEVIFPFPDPTDADFDDVSPEEREYYITTYKDLNIIKTSKLHCTACDRHLGSIARNDSRMRSHPMLRTLVCNQCHTFYNSGEFEKGDDGSELYCRWCGQGGQVYCCSDCPHVFCAKCIKRNMGIAKIKEIENKDDWKCFKCNPACLKDLRAQCWALIRYCDLKNKLAYSTEDPVLKTAYQKDCAVDYTECCKNKKKNKFEGIKRKESERRMQAQAAIVSKIPPTIQSGGTDHASAEKSVSGRSRGPHDRTRGVKKFASINLDEVKNEKKAQKRSISPANKVFVKTPVNLGTPRLLNVGTITGPKKVRMQTPTLNKPPRFAVDKTYTPQYPRIRPKPPQFVTPMMSSTVYNGLNNIGNFNMSSDNINLSLESLTQGLDMTAVAAASMTKNLDDVVCTPDFPLEPLCEVHEETGDDDVECMTPGPVAAPKLASPPPLVPRSDLAPDNIIQMTENDVTVNAATGGLKFRVDPQTLSSNKMYRLPDGRIFAINANPNMPGGYSATIVAVSETQTPRGKGATFAAKLSAVQPPAAATATVTAAAAGTARASAARAVKSRTVNKIVRPAKKKDAVRELDMNVPVEWYRYNLVDAVDALEYSLARLNKLKTQTSTVFLRSRSVDEMRALHRSLERLLNTSSARFREIRDNLQKGLKQYLARKSGGAISDEDDDDVEILPDESDDPIFIDENSLESNPDTNGNESQEVDLTTASSDHNDSGERERHTNETRTKTVLNPFSKMNKYRNESEESIKDISNENSMEETIIPDRVVNENNVVDNEHNTDEGSKVNVNKDRNKTILDVGKKENRNRDDDDDDDSIKNDKVKESNVRPSEASVTKTKEPQKRGVEPKNVVNGSDDKDGADKEPNFLKDNMDIDEHLDEKTASDESKTQETEMSEELIETLLKDDDAGDDISNSNSVMDVSEVI